MRNLRRYYSAGIAEFLRQSDSEILGIIHQNNISAETAIQQDNALEDELMQLYYTAISSSFWSSKSATRSTGYPHMTRSMTTHWICAIFSARASSAHEASASTRCVSTESMVFSLPLFFCNCVWHPSMRCWHKKPTIVHPF